MEKRKIAFQTFRREKDITGKERVSCLFDFPGGKNGLFLVATKRQRERRAEEQIHRQIAKKTFLSRSYISPIRQKDLNGKETLVHKIFLFKFDED